MRYWKYVATGYIFAKPDYWEPIHEGWVEATKEEYEAFSAKYRF